MITIKAQSILEYSIFIVCVIAAFIAMQIYVKRGIEGRLKQTSDDIGEQYAPTNTTTDITIKKDVDQTIISELVPLINDANVALYTDDGLPKYGITSNVSVTETTTRSGNEKLGAFEDNLWK